MPPRLPTKTRAKEEESLLFFLFFRPLKNSKLRTKAAVCAAALLQIVSFDLSSLLQMDHLAAGVECAMHFHSLAFILLHFVLVVDIVTLAAGLVLQHILVA